MPGHGFGTHWSESSDARKLTGAEAKIMEQIVMKNRDDGTETRPMSNWGRRKEGLTALLEHVKAGNTVSDVLLKEAGNLWRDPPVQYVSHPDEPKELERVVDLFTCAIP